MIMNEVAIVLVIVYHLRCKFRSMCRLFLTYYVPGFDLLFVCMSCRKSTTCCTILLV